MLEELQIDHGSSTPVYRQIADGVRAAALDGRLRPGHRLPPTRDLARQLGINRQTVVAAYEYLATEGWVQGADEYARRNTTPREASRSRFGVCPRPGF